MIFASNFLRRWLAALLVAAPAIASSGEVVQDPKELRAQLKAIKDPARLDAFLMEQKLLEPTEGNVPIAEARLRSYTRGAAYDLFEVNLFGSATKEAILQLRFGQVFYLVAFFERGTGEWRRIPGVLGVNTAPESACRPARCPGFFCLDFAEVRKKGENLIVGRSCEITGGADGGEVEELDLWQVTGAGPRDVARATLRETGRPREGPRDRRWEFEFEGGFPRRLVMRERLAASRLGPPIVVPLALSE